MVEVEDAGEGGLVNVDTRLPLAARVPPVADERSRGPAEALGVGEHQRLGGDVGPELALAEAAELGLGERAGEVPGAAER